MSQQGQLIQLKRMARDGEPLWAYRYRVGGRDSQRVQRGGFASERDAAEALERELERLRRDRRISRSLTLAELVVVYLAQHDVDPVTVVKLRWLLGKAVAANLAPRYRPMVFFGAATGLRPGEWVALEQRDVDREARVVYVRRAFTKGRLKCTKTEASRRAVPLQAIALDAIERQPPSRRNPLLFPGERGGYLDLHNFRDHHWKPAQRAAGIEPLRRIYDLRHTFATFALRAGISTFDLSRYMGASLTMIDRHYGHLARDGREHAIRLLDELSAAQRPRWTLVDAAWTSQPAVAASADNGSSG
jgi:integrase